MVRHVRRLFPKVKLSERFRDRKSGTIPLPRYPTPPRSDYRVKGTSGTPMWL